MKKIIIIRLTGQININSDIKMTLKLLNLPRKYSCVIVEDNKETLGMINKVKDFVTWGSVTEETLTALESKRKEGAKCIALQPPKGGFERKGTKKSYKNKGALGNRKDDMDALVKKMI